MNATLRASIASTPIPVENGAFVEACVSDVEGKWRTLWSFDGGRSKVPFGPAYSLSDALAVATALNERGRP